MLKRGAAPQFFPIASLWESSWHHCPCWFCSVCSKHAQDAWFVCSSSLSSALLSLFTPLRRLLVHRMMSWVPCVYGDWMWHALSLCRLRSQGRQSVWMHLPLPKGSVTAPHNRPCFHTSYFRKHPRARGPITRQFGYGDIKITEKPGDI